MILGIPMPIGGVEYIVPPLSLGSLEEYGDAIDDFQSGNLGLKGFSIVIDVVLAALKRNYPDMTRDMVKNGIDLAEAGDFFANVMDVSGLRRKALEAGKATAGQ
jgi:hypothetical protein